jgi:hypothetical protein
VRDLFAQAGRPFLSSPWPWAAWALLLPAAALATPAVARAFSAAGVLILWSSTILAGGAVEAGTFLRRRTPRATSPLSAWVLRLQGNTSLVAVLLSALLVWLDGAWALPGVWMLLLGHSFYTLGGLAFPAFRGYGLLLEAAGFAALWPDGRPLWVFAAATAAGNLGMAWAVWREGRRAR